MHLLPAKKNLPSKEEELLVKRWLEGRDEEAISELLSANIRFIKNRAVRYSYPDLDFDDLVSEAVVAVLLGLPKWDPKRSNIRTFMSACIRNSLNRKVFRYLGKGLVGGHYSCSDKAFTALRAERGQRLLGRPVDVVVGAQMVYVKNLETAKNNCDGYLKALPKAAVFECPYDVYAASSEISSILGSTVEGLSLREKYILHERVMSLAPKPLSKIGAEYGVSVEAIRMAEVKLLGKLRTALEDKGITSYSDVFDIR